MCVCVFAYAELVGTECTPLPDWEVKEAPPTLASVPAPLLAPAVGPALLSPCTKHWVRVAYITYVLLCYFIYFCTVFSLNKNYLLSQKNINIIVFATLQKDEITVPSLINIQRFISTIQFFMDAFQMHSLRKSLWCGFQWLQAKVRLRMLRRTQIWRSSFVQVQFSFNRSLWNISSSESRYVGRKCCLSTRGAVFY